MVKIVGKYQHERSENLEEYFRTLGVPYVVRKMMSISNPRIEISQNDDEWTLKNVTMLRTQEIKFKLGVEYEEFMPAGVVLKNMTNLEGDCLITVSIGPDGNKVTRKYEFRDDQLILTMTQEKNDVVCTRYFKRIE
ncbi:sodium/calcium exchanger regulatory protein 1 [Diachasma alloeum]|uniref:sodium/calcium exchanger regulatory protein 1 n=1 Tax=Diachasma alloeum TaxID=454923 RepID=UPI00073811BD|nr:sodium/calcium exchanger regulatory protein 1 [Diachasma alloeum]